MAQLENGTVKFKIKSFRKIPNPYATTEGEPSLGDPKPCMYFAIADVKDVPDDIPMKTNPREQKLTTAVAKKIQRSLLAEEGTNDFYLLNRGMLISAASAEFNNYDNTLTITFEDDSVHGDVDGGHTYRIIKENRDQLERGQQYVKLEILTGVEGIFQDLADARNTSTQVKDKSIAELRKQFELIKAAIAGEPYAGQIYFEENAEGTIDVGEILQVLNMFNIDRYPVSSLDSFPTVSYNGKANCIKYYLQQYKQDGEDPRNPYVKMQPIMRDIFRLYDEVETGMPAYYQQAFTNGHYGAVKGVVVAKGGKKFYSKFFGNSMDVSTPTAFIYPILGSLRALVVEGDDGLYHWKKDPKQVLGLVGKELVSTTIDRSRTLGNNPNAVGKDSGNWQTLFMRVVLASM